MLPEQTEEHLVVGGKSILVTSKIVNRVCSVYINNSTIPLFRKDAKEYSSSYTREELLNNLRKHWYIVDESVPTSRLIMVRRNTLIVPLQCYHKDYNFNQKCCPVNKLTGKELPFHKRRMVKELFPLKYVHCFGNLLIAIAEAEHIIEYSRRI